MHLRLAVDKSLLPTRVHLEIVGCGWNRLEPAGTGRFRPNGPATAVAWQTTGRLWSGVARRYAAPGPVLTPQCPWFAMRPQSQVGFHNFKVHPSYHPPPGTSLRGVDSDNCC